MICWVGFPYVVVPVVVAAAAPESWLCVLVGFFGVAGPAMGYFLMEFCPGGTLEAAMRRLGDGSMMAASRKTFWAHVRCTGVGI